MTKPIDKWANFHWPENEIWKPISGFPGYEVSDMGRIRSFKKGNPRLMTPDVDKDGYFRIALVREGRYFPRVVSRLVALAFIGLPPEGKTYCCHKDGSRNNNIPSNLRWDSQKGNINDKLIHGTHQAGEKHGNSKITSKKAIEIRRLIFEIPKYKGKLKFIAEKTGVSYQIVTSIAHKGAWSSAC